MSIKLIDLTIKLVSSKISVDDFEFQFFKLWSEESRSGDLAKDSKVIGGCLHEIFDLAERFTSDTDRMTIELDKNTLEKEAKTTLEKFKFL